MLSRVMFGCGSVGRTLVGSLRERSGELLVLSDDDHRVETLRSSGVTARLTDIGRRDALTEIDRAIDVVIVASDDPERNVGAAEVATEGFPGAFVLAYAGDSATVEQRNRLASHADRLIDPGRVAADHVLDRIGEGSLRPRRLWRLLRELDGPLAVLTHDNPDPDAIAAAVALESIAEAAGTEADPCYFGKISHQENRALINVLDLDLKRLDAPEGIEEYDAIALVDHARPGVNDQLPEDTEIDVVLDHHPPRAPIEARFVDLRSDVGATSTLLVEHFDRLDLTVEESVATALLYGIRVDTQEFSRQVAPVDFEAAAFLLSRADSEALSTVETPSMSAETLETIGRAIHNRSVEDGVLTSAIENLQDRDALAQAADRLLDLETVNTALVYGIIDGVVYASGRTRGSGLDLGEVLREAFDRIGSAGGHADMAGAQIPVGGLFADSDEEPLLDVTREMIEERFAAAVANEIAAEATVPLAEEDRELPYSIGANSGERGRTSGLEGTERTDGSDGDNGPDGDDGTHSDDGHERGT